MNKDVEIQKPFRLLRDRCPKILRAPGNRILVDVTGDRLHGYALDIFRRREIGESLRKIHGTVLDGLARHLADDGFREQTRFARNMT